VADSKYNPDLWVDYVRKLQIRGVRPEMAWAGFASQYRVAGNFSCSHFFHLSDRVARSYSEAMRLLLAYSAFEAACQAANVKVHASKIDGADGFINEARTCLRTAFKDVPEDLFPLRAALGNSLLSRKVDRFLSGEDDDLQPISAALRSLFAHGVWMPKGSSALSSAACRGLSLSSQCILIASNGIFERHYYDGFSS
jgi:hypothetical protein